jgi:hypothetical protein
MKREIGQMCKKRTEHILIVREKKNKANVLKRTGHIVSVHEKKKKYQCAKQLKTKQAISTVFKSW